MKNDLKDDLHHVGGSNEGASLQIYKTLEISIIW